ncbi:hypothetical protein [Pandoraea sputorum]|uniref:hypothetical protein n=1 Tax=Pandoraea sputorum TaxID=93222 RepID=UPI00123EE16C|nr:hypothetical protein [Pandoraea sputorum]
MEIKDANIYWRPQNLSAAAKVLDTKIRLGPQGERNRDEVCREMGHLYYQPEPGKPARIQLSIGNEQIPLRGSPAGGGNGPKLGDVLLTHLTGKICDHFIKTAGVPADIAYVHAGDIAELMVSPGFLEADAPMNGNDEVHQRAITISFVDNEVRLRKTTTYTEKAASATDKDKVVPTSDTDALPPDGAQELAKGKQPRVKLTKVVDLDVTVSSERSFFGSTQSLALKVTGIAAWVDNDESKRDAQLEQFGVPSQSTKSTKAEGCLAWILQAFTRLSAYCGFRGIRFKVSTPAELACPVTNDLPAWLKRDLEEVAAFRRTAILISAQPAHGAWDNGKANYRKSNFNVIRNDAKVDETMQRAAFDRERRQNWRRQYNRLYSEGALSIEHNRFMSTRGLPEGTYRYADARLVALAEAGTASAAPSQAQPKDRESALKDFLFLHCVSKRNVFKIDNTEIFSGTVNQRWLEYAKKLRAWELAIAKVEEEEHGSTARAEAETKIPKLLASACEVADDFALSTAPQNASQNVVV